MPCATTFVLSTLSLIGALAISRERPFRHWMSRISRLLLEEPDRSRRGERFSNDSRSAPRATWEQSWAPLAALSETGMLPSNGYPTPEQRREEQEVMSNNVTSISTRQSNKVAEAATAFDAAAALALAEAEDAAAPAKNQPYPAINYETFTKEQAQELFDDRRKNRQVRTAGVSRYTKMMNDGQWRIYDRAQAPLLIDAKGRLAGGQHRVDAFLKSNLTSIVFPVARNASEEEIRNQDAGINRSFNDYVAMFHDMPEFSNISEAKLNAVGKILLNKSSPTAAQVVETIVESQSVLQIINDMIGTKATVQRYAPLIAAFVCSHGVMTESVWKDALTNFDSSTNAKNSPMALLAGSLDTRRQNELFLKALHALKASHEGEDIAELVADEAHLKWCGDSGAV